MPVKSAFCKNLLTTPETSLPAHGGGNQPHSEGASRRLEFTVIQEPFPG